MPLSLILILASESQDHQIKGGALILAVNQIEPIAIRPCLPVEKTISIWLQNIKGLQKRKVSNNTVVVFLLTFII